MDIAYNISGKGEPIIFIHGIGSRKHSWNGIINKLKGDFKCIAYDLRGHGDSKVDKKNFSMNDLVEDIEKLRSYLCFDKIHLIGHSLGGMIGPSYTRKYQHRVLSLTLLSTAAFRTTADQQNVLNVIDRVKNEDFMVVAPSLINRWFTKEFVLNNKDTIEKRIKQVIDTPIETFVNVFKIYALTEMSPWLNEINVPSLVMTGEGDIGCNPRMNKKIADCISSSKLEILKNLKHSITIEAPDLVGDKIKVFLQNSKN